MCGIAGTYTNRGINTEEMIELWENIADRGRHACGFSWFVEDGDRPLTFKAPKSSLVHSKKLRKIGTQNRWLMMHTRYATQGSVYDNNNNHPIKVENILFTHNGVVGNEKALYDLAKYQEQYEVDSEAIGAVLARLSIEALANYYQGTLALVWADLNSPNTLHFYTNGMNPLHFARKLDGSLLWASSYHHLNDLPEVVDIFAAKAGVMYTIDESMTLQAKTIVKGLSSVNRFGTIF